MASSSGHLNSSGCPKKGRAGADFGAAAPAAKASSSAPVEAERLAAEAERLAAVRLFCASPPGESCSSVSTLMRASLGVPLAFVCLVGEEQVHLSQPLQPEQQAGAAWVTLRRGEAPGELTAQPPGGFLVVQDLAADTRYRGLPCVTGPPHLACLAAAPLVSSPSGEAAASVVYGSLVVADTKPRAFTTAELETLALSASLLVRDIQWAAQAVQREQAQQAQQELLRCAQEAIKGHQDAMLALDASRDGWPVLFCSRAAILACGAGLQQPAGVPFWQLFDVCEAGSGLESSGSLRSMDSMGSPGMPPPYSAAMSSAPPAYGAGPSHGSAVAERLALADSLQQAVGTPEAAQWLLAAGKPFSMSCRLKRGGRESMPPRSGVGGSLAFPGHLAGWAEEAADKQLPAPANARWSLSAPPPRASTIARHLQHAAADTAPLGRPPRLGSLDSALAVMQQGSSAPAKEDMFAVSFAPCTPALLRSLGAAAVPDLPGATSGGRSAGSASGGSASGGSAGGSSAGSLPPCWVVTLRPQPDITSGSLQRAHSACLSNGEDVEAFLKPEALQDVRLGRLIGAGAYGRTYLGRWRDQRVAVKIIPTKPLAPKVTPVVSGTTASDFHSAEAGTVYEEAAQQKAAESDAPFMEALLSTSLEHPHIVKTLGFGMCRSKEGEEEVWVVQELCTCGTLARAVERGIFTDRATGQPRLQRVLMTAIEIASAIAFLHSKGLVHADLSGNNILLNRSSTPDERGFVALVGDFGLARPLDLRTSISTGTYGTPTYMSPEMISEGRLSPEVDIFSAGVLLHEMLSGQRAWQGLSVVQVVNMVAIMKRSLPIPDSWPLPLQELVRSCLSHDPKARPTARQLLAELKSLLADEVARSLA